MHYKKVLRYSKFGLLLAIILLFVNNFKHDLTDKIPKIETSENSEISENKNKAFDESLYREVEELTIEELPIVETTIVEAPIEETPIVETPIEKAPIVETPIVETPIEKAPVVETPIEEISIEEINVNQSNKVLNFDKKVEIIEESVTSTKSSPELLYTKESADIIRLTEAGINTLRKQRHELSANEPYKSRIDKLHENCKSYTNKNIDLSRFIYNDKHKYIMCEVPKAACTSWKRFWWHLSGFEGYKTVEGDKLIIGHGFITTLNNVPVEEAFKRLKEYTTFFVNRKPLQRAVSAHSSKFTSRVKLDGYKNRLGKPAALKYLPEFVHNIKIRDYQSKDYKTLIEKSDVYKNLTQREKEEVMTSLTALNVGELDFNLFTKLVMGQYAKGHPEKVDVHWRNTMDLCNPCAVNYDVIVDFDHLNEDSNKLLEYLQRNDEGEKVFFPDRKSLINTNKADEMLNQLPKSEYENLVKNFERDLNLLKLDL